jgi:hypothetical protein
MVKVYSHYVEVGGERSLAPHKRTVEAIERLAHRGSHPIPETEEEVDASLVDGEGRYMPAQVASDA